MVADSEAHEAARGQRVAAADAADAGANADAERGRHHTDTAAFLNNTSRAAYGAAEGGAASLEEAVGRRRFFSQRTGGGGDVAGP